MPPADRPQKPENWPPETREFGARVILQGFNARADLNGMAAIVATKKAPYKVLVLKTEESVSVKPENVVAQNPRKRINPMHPERKRIRLTTDCWSPLNLRLERPAEPLPPKAQRVANHIYRTEANNLVTYSSDLKNQVKICQECASKGIILSANYEDQEGKKKKLCKQCATAQGRPKTKPRRPCEICAEQTDPDTDLLCLEAAYMNKAGKKNKLCSFHAREERTYKPVRPCEICADRGSDPLLHAEANHVNEAGKKNKLCTVHAREVGTWKVLHPCELCPDGKKKEAAYMNKKDQKRKLCASCAHTEDTWKPQNPCELCPEDKKKDAAYRNKEGLAKKLCGACAAAQGMWESKQICQRCPDGVKRVATGRLPYLFDSDGFTLGKKLTWVCFFCMDAFNFKTNDFDWIKRPAEPGQGAFDEQGNHYETYRPGEHAYKCPDCDTVFSGANGTRLMQHRSAFTLKA